MPIWDCVEPIQLKLPSLTNNYGTRTKPAYLQISDFGVDLPSNA